MLKAAGKTVWLGGNIGTPLLDQADKMQPDHVAVLELSSFQLMTMKKTPSVAVITNLSPNHLDWHRDFEEYVEAKCNLFKNQGKDDVLVLNYDNLPSRELAEKAPGQVRFFSRESLALPGGVWLKNGVLLDNGEPIMETGDIRIPGMHNVENFLGVIAVLWGEVEIADFVKVAKEFGGVEHRIEFVREVGGVRWYNDSIATSPTRVLAGLRSFEQKIIVLAGGYDKKIPFEPMAETVCDRVKLLILMGVTAPKIEAAVTAAKNYNPDTLRILHASSMEEAVAIAQKEAQNGDIVTLSPACASFDLYPNFEVRGQHYKRLVKELAE
jgi:UDP-N-acetylmuramoylalanine--D-glutamate ligase